MRFKDVEGYIAIVFVILTFVNPVLAAFPRRYATYALAIGIALWGLGWLFSISGVRRNKGGALIAAWLSLAILILHATYSLLVAYLPKLVGTG